MGGLSQIIKPSLADTEGSEIAAKTAVLLGSAAQSNPSVQDSVLEANLIPVLIDLFSRKESKFCCHELKSRAIYAISSLGKELKLIFIGLRWGGSPPIEKYSFLKYEA